ncbi:MAG: hypothetical protein SWL02_11305, partial [Pseudomonadota bacterium]|nr:hypothetical protein [Pseudomonadota bacterium]
GKVKKDITIIALLASIVAGFGFYDDWLGAVVGMAATLGFGIFSLIRLAGMSELNGPVGRVMKRFSKKL